MKRLMTRHEPDHFQPVTRWRVNKVLANLATVATFVQVGCSHSQPMEFSNPLGMPISFVLNIPQA